MNQVTTPFGYQVEGVEDFNKLLYKTETTKSVFFTRLTIKVYVNRLSLEYRPFVGGGESRETFSALDVGDIQIKKGRKRATISVFRRNSCDILFEIRNLELNQSERLKDALDQMLTYRYMTRRGD